MTCPQCGAETKDWPCPNCGFPVISKYVRKVPKKDSCSLHKQLCGEKRIHIK